MSFNDTAQNIDRVVSHFDELAKGLQNTMREELKKVFAAFFEEFPQVKTIHWTQYTPHFNDGDECVFRLRDIWFTTTEHTELEEREHTWGEGDDGLINDWSAVIEDKKLDDAINTLTKMMNSSTLEGVLKATYGDHAWVKVFKDGYDVSDYDHD